MIFGPTNRVLATSAIHTARVLTALSNASHREGTCVVGATGVDTFAVLTNLSCATIDVLEADGHKRDSTENVCISGIACRTGASWSVTNGATNRVRATRLRIVAWVETLSVDAGQILRTALVQAASHRAGVFITDLSEVTVTISGALKKGQLGDGFAEVKWVAFIAWRTAALGTMKYWLTLGVETARSLHTARVDALAVVAGSVKCAITVRATPTDALAFVADVTRVAGTIVQTLLEYLHTVVVVAHFARTTLAVG